MLNIEYKYAIIIQGNEYLTTYEFNTMQAKHLFCKICGVQSFYQPRSNSDGWGIIIFLLKMYLSN